MVGRHACAPQGRSVWAAGATLASWASTGPPPTPLAVRRVLVGGSRTHRQVLHALLAPVGTNVQKQANAQELAKMEDLVRAGEKNVRFVRQASMHLQQTPPLARLAQ